MNGLRGGPWYPRPEFCWFSSAGFALPSARLPRRTTEHVPVRAATCCGMTAAIGGKRFAERWNDADTRRVSGNQYLHHKTDAYRHAVRRKIAAYHRHIQLGLIAQGLLQILSARSPQRVWQSFGSWIRTIRPGLAPSEQVAAIAMRNTLPEFLATAAKTSILVKFIRGRLDLSRSEGTSLAA